MATILRDLSYQYQWLYDGISRAAALAVGGESRFRQLALQGLPIAQDSKILDLCCGSGQTTQVLVQRSRHVTGLDASPLSIKRAKQNVPQADYVEAFAEEIPLSDNEFDLVHTSAAMHEMETEQLRQILQEVYRVLKPNGYFAMVDFHAPTNPIFVPGLAAFFWLFETETAWQFIKTDVAALLTEIGFQVSDRTLHSGGSLQVIQAQKPAS
ncbi:class I SAM-dependent methyltransferase [Phormidesmis priestleyi ULC007]|uniref:Class I SAM-dependent methyltransferase n=1 Tax=Phormidesmis priestleyi ULC007 TaxID=1920490 RepID=A0A2T1DGB0_9CYAN|nr:class I SAM-dependent methyltransferase [Phormidesmis priestleyi]PSB19539.1 class I SAM-dependent methyltransferase [Phormidesmis priestleyi ULC007]PZO53021.1 MAG: class I SAM-dependent methyltransferase [Phormidesmis priestleyi]